MSTLALVLVALSVLHIEGASLWGSLLIMVAAVLVGVQFSGEPFSDDNNRSSPQTDLKCGECGLRKVGRVCCDDHPSVGG